MPPLRQALLLLLWVSLCPEIDAADDHFHTMRHTKEHGLVHDHVTHVLQDDSGFLWIATRDGLARFDGSRFETYQQAPQPEAGLVDNEILCLARTGDQLWLGTRSGSLSRMSLSSGRFTHFKVTQTDPETAETPISALYADPVSNAIWVGTLGAGLACLPTDGAEWVRFPPDILGASSVYAVGSGGGRTLWLGTDTGLIRVIIKPGSRFDVRTLHVKGQNGARMDPVTALHQSDEETLWVGTATGALLRLDPTTEKPIKIHQVAGRVTAIQEDRAGHVWFAADKGLFRFDRGLGKLQDISLKREAGLTRASRASSLMLDQSGALWAGTEFGFVRLDTVPSLFQSFHPTADDPGEITAIVPDKTQTNQVWLGTAAGHLSTLNLNTGTFQKHVGDHQTGMIHALHDTGTHLVAGTADMGAVSISKRDGGINSLFSQAAVLDLLPEQAQARRIWLATAGAGLVLYDPASGGTDTFLPKADKTAGPPGKTITALCRDQRGDLWMGVRGVGLSMMGGSGSFVHYRAQPEMDGALNSTRIAAIQELEGYIWIATQGGGLNRLDPATGRFYAWRTRHGLPDDTLQGLLTDAKGRLWMSSHHGMALFDPKDVSIKRFDPRDGLQDFRFNTGVAAKTGRDALLFGGARGLTVVRPGNLKTDAPPPKVLITGVRIQNQPRGDGDPYLQGEQISKMVLPHNFGTTTLEYKVLDFSAPDQVTYQYRLDEFDYRWHQGRGADAKAIYTGLPAGDYTFRIKASARDSDWGPETTLALKVERGPWWAWSVPIVLIVVMILLVRLLFHKKPDPFMEPPKTPANQSPKLREQFLAESSAEMREPVSAIVDLAEALLEGVDGNISPKTRSHLEMIRSSGRRLTQVVDEIIDFSRLKTETQELNLERVDVHSMADIVVSVLREAATANAISLINRTEPVLPTVTADAKRLERILVNLVEFGFNFCVNGEISILAEQQDEHVRIEVRHMGSISLPGTQTMSDIENPQSTSVRLGLEIARMLIGLHDAKLEITHHPEEAVGYHFMLPVAFLEPNNLAGSGGTGLPPALPHKEWYDHSAESATGMSAGTEEFRVLVVDDEKINRMLLTEFLRLQHYDAVDASDGFEALAILESHAFDLVLLDIMMPRMSGYEVCRKIRTLYSEEALPIIFLSAKDQATDAAAGFEAGGNDYLTKPVSKKELLIRIRLHLRNLEVNRRLEALISERTAKLAARTRELEDMNQEILKTREQVILQEKMAGLGMVTAGLAHEINNPTNFTFSAAQTMKRDLDRFKTFLFELAGDDADPEIKEAFDTRLNPLFNQIATIEEGCGRIVELVSDIRSASRTDRDHPIRADLHKGLRTTLRLVRTHYKHDVEFDLDLEGEVFVDCRPSQLNQVFMNLMVNACQAIRKRRDHQSSPQPGVLRISSRVENDRVIIDFADNGTGMPEALRAQIFEPFFTTKGQEEGTGLGLSISKDIVAHHGGELSVSSVEGEGSTFILSLPYQPEREAGDVPI